jgi:HAD superfamily hydrolase (TIGR01509 family)
MGLLRGVIFDVDGVLVLSEPLIAEAAMKLFAEKGYDVDEEEFRPFIGAGEDRFIGGVAEARGIPLDPDRDKARLYEIYLELIRGRLRPVPGAHDFIARCRSAGLRLAAASGADRVKVDGNLAEGGFPRELFDIVIDGTLVTRKKPAPEIFLLAAERLELPAEQCLVVEDAVNGVVAAKASGARRLALTTSFGAPDLAKAGADWTASDLTNPPPPALEW